MLSWISGEIIAPGPQHVFNTESSLPLPLGSGDLGMRRQDTNPKAYSVWEHGFLHPANLALGLGQTYCFLLETKPGWSGTGRTGKERPLRTVWGKASSHLSPTPALQQSHRISWTLSVLTCKCHHSSCISLHSGPFWYFPPLRREGFPGHMPWILHRPSQLTWSETHSSRRWGNNEPQMCLPEAGCRLDLRLWKLPLCRDRSLFWVCLRNSRGLTRVHAGQLRKILIELQAWGWLLKNRGDWTGQGIVVPSLSFSVLGRRWPRPGNLPDAS